jgi:hypothetical protein
MEVDIDSRQFLYLYWECWLLSESLTSLVILVESHVGWIVGTYLDAGITVYVPVPSYLGR